MPTIEEVFYCIYCNRTHPNRLNTDEHIIPQAFKNKNYVLRDACKHFNHFMAHSFEKRFRDLEPIKELLLLIDSPKKPVYRGEIATHLDKKVHRYILPSGKSELTEHPQYSETSSISLPIKGRDGLIYPYELKLPFSIKNGVTGIPRMVKERNKDIEIEKLKLANYLQQLSNIPSINKDFDNFLKEVGGTFTFKGITVEESGIPKEQVILPEEPKQIVKVNNEILFKFFFKIAWTHTVKQLGVEKLSNPVADWIIKYLTTGNIDDKELIYSHSELFTRPVKIDDDEYVFWNYGIDETQSLIEEIQDDYLKANFAVCNKHRYELFKIASTFIAFRTTGVIDDELRSRKSELRYHNLSLRTMEFSGKNVTVCCINLFGEFFNVIVKLSESPITDVYPNDIRIEF